MTIGERIKKRREELNMSQEELANKLGYKSRTSINKIELNHQDLKRSKVQEIANALNTTPSYIMGWRDNVGNFIENAYPTETVKIPVLGEVAAGIPIFANENYEDFEEISEQLASTGEFFGLKIKGDSMSPRIAEGDTVIVRQQNDADSGDLVIVLINGDSATCKRLLKYSEGISLLSFNPAYEPMDFTNKEIIEKPVKIIGKVIENRQRY